LFRPPFGDYNNQVIEAAEQLGYLTIQWDVDSLDWKEQGVGPLINNVIYKVKNGSIVLFHNNSRDILEALPTILDTLIKNGYEIVPISQLVYRKNYIIDVHGIQKPITGGEYGEDQ
jgi:peptidoglycan/xylan/chitin deacetylase (PgdA/CDA1 family)